MRYSKYISSAIVTFLCVGTYGCGESLVIQCNKLSTVVNKTRTIIPAQDANASRQPGELNRFADGIEVVRAEMQELKLSDARLKDYQGKFIEYLSESSQVLREASKSVTDKDAAAFDKSKQAAAAAMQKEGTLVGDVNKYCAGG